MDNTTRFRSYPQMATVKKTAEVFGVSASYIPAGLEETVGGIRRVAR